MNPTVIGIVIGVLVALVWVIGGFTGLLLALVLGTLGGLIGAHREGRIDLESLLRGRGRG